MLVSALPNGLDFGRIQAGESSWGSSDTALGAGGQVGIPGGKLRLHFCHELQTLDPGGSNLPELTPRNGMRYCLDLLCTVNDWNMGYVGIKSVRRILPEEQHKAFFQGLPWRLHPGVCSDFSQLGCAWK